MSARIAVRVPHFLVVPMILARTDLIVIVPSRVAAVFAGLGNFKVIVAFDRTDYFRARFDESNQRNFDASVSGCHTPRCRSQSTLSSSFAAAVKP